MPNKAPVYELKIGGKPATDGVMSNIKKVLYEEAFSETSRVEITIKSGLSFDLTPELVKFDTPIELSLGYWNDVERVFEGEIVEVNPTMTGDEGSLNIIAYDYSHWFKRQNPGAVHTEKSYLDLVTKIITNVGASLEKDISLEAVIPDRDKTLAKLLITDDKGVVQIKMTDWEILEEAANLANCKLLCRGKQVFMADIIDFQTMQGKEHQYTFVWNAHGDELYQAGIYPLIDFDPRVSKADMRTHVEVEAWSPFTSTGVRYDKTNIPNTAKGYTDIKVKSSVTETLRIVGVARDVVEAHAMATSELHRRTERLVQGNAKVQGNPYLRIGQKQNIRIHGFGDIGKQFSGTHTLKGVRHTFNEDGYFTSFDVMRERLSAT